ncbi:MAG: phosphoribosylaminoimidazolesuccinocarboxamide synthase [Minisyncoccia bacterium]
MPALSPLRQSVPVLPDLELLNRGKVRDTYRLPNGLLLIVATNGISIFDFVLNALVPEKGAILTAMSHFWLTRIEKELGIPTHLVAAGPAIDPYLPAALRKNPQLQMQAMVVRKLSMTDREFVARKYLTGTGWKSYLKTGTVCGISLPPGLQDGDKLPQTIATPTTKAAEGHDEHVDAAFTQENFPEETALTLEIFEYGRKVARGRGIITADTKFEFGRDESGNVFLADEALTPDSSRFWEHSAWRASRSLVEKRKAPPSYDKQFVREWGKEQGIDQLDAKSSEDIALVQALQVPAKLIAATTQIYRYIFWRLTGMRLEQYQREVMGIAVENKKRSLAIVFGSTSDIPKVDAVLKALENGMFSSGILDTRSFFVLSCHRNPKEMFYFATHGCRGANAVIAVGGKAFALPGILDAVIHSTGNQEIPVIGVALGEKGSIDLEAAKLSISQLPGQPVVMNEMEGTVYEGASGFSEALNRVANGEFPVKARVAKAMEEISLATFA